MSRDPVIDRIEAELRESQFEAWDVETFLADRHKAKIEALLVAPGQGHSWQRWWVVTKQITSVVMAFVGYITTVTMLGVWLLSGEFPISPVG